MGMQKNDEPHHCDALLERFSEYLDKDMDEQSAAELEQHLEACQACAAKMVEFKYLVECYHSFRKMAQQPCMSEDCRQKLRANLKD